MNTKFVMMCSAIMLAIISFALSFMPSELAAVLGQESTVVNQLVLQLLGALYFGFAMLNWMAKGSLIGGIYNRPIAIANFAHFMVGSLALLKVLSKNTHLPEIFWLLAVAYTIFAAFFGLITFRHPLKAKSNEQKIVVN